MARCPALFLHRLNPARGSAKPSRTTIVEYYLYSSFFRTAQSENVAFWRYERASSAERAPTLSVRRSGSPRSADKASKLKYMYIMIFTAHFLFTGGPNCNILALGAALAAQDGEKASPCFPRNATTPTRVRNSAQRSGALFSVQTLSRTWYRYM